MPSGIKLLELSATRGGVKASLGCSICFSPLVTVPYNAMLLVTVPHNATLLVTVHHNATLLASGNVTISTMHRYVFFQTCVVKQFTAAKE